MKRQDLYIVIIIVTVTALVYARTLQNGFLTWDDDSHITNNPDIQSLSLHNIKTIFTSYYVNMYHPLVTLSFALEYHFFGLNPAAYHATNVLFHLANVVLVFFLVFSLSHRRETAFIAACLFGIHPMHVESVAWVTERKDVLYAFFYLSALIFYLRFIRQGNIKNYWLAFLSFGLSLFSKTTALTLPLLLLLIDAYNRRTLTARTMLEKLPFFILSLVFGFIALDSQEVVGNYQFIDRIFLASYSLCYYLFHVFLPTNLSALHLLPIKVNGLLALNYYLTPLPLIFLAFIATRKGILQCEYIFGLLFFVVILSLNIHIIPVGMAIVSERYTYLAYIGLYYIIGQIYSFSHDRYQDFFFSWKKLIMTGGILLVLFFSFLTYQRLGLWKNSLLLFEDAAVKANTTAEANFTQMLAYEQEGVEKNRMNLYTEAIEWFNKAISLNPEYYNPYFNRGLSHYYLHHDTAAIKDFDKVIELNPSYASVYYSRAIIYLSWNRREEACTDLWKAFRLGMNGAFILIQENCF